MKLRFLRVPLELILFFVITCWQTNQVFASKCIPMQKDFVCSELPYLGYNHTVLPNQFGHQTLLEVQTALSEFEPFIDTKCSPAFKGFLCLLYTPVCTVLELPIPPCRAFCQNALTTECLELYKSFTNNEIPEFMQCDRYPESGLCIQQNITSDGVNKDTKAAPLRKSIPEPKTGSSNFIPKHLSICT